VRGEREITIKCLAGSASTITITPNLAAVDLIDGVASLALAAGQSATVKVGAALNWITV